MPPDVIGPVSVDGAKAPPLVLFEEIDTLAGKYSSVTMVSVMVLVDVPEVTVEAAAVPCSCPKIVLIYGRR